MKHIIWTPDKAPLHCDNSDTYLAKLMEMLRQGYIVRGSARNKAGTVENISMVRKPKEKRQ